MILKSDRIAAESLVRQVRAVCPAAACVAARGVAAAHAALAQHRPDFVIVGLGLADGDAIDFLWHTTSECGNAPRCWVVTSAPKAWPLLALRRLPIGGVIDSVFEGTEAIDADLRALATGSRPPVRTAHDAPTRAGAAFRWLTQLTPTERLMLAFVGSGLDAKGIVGLLDLQVRSVEAVLQHLHAKLGAHHNTELALLAAGAGLVRFTAAGPVRVGFTLLLADYFGSGQRPAAPTAALLALHPEAAEFVAARRRRNASTLAPTDAAVARRTGPTLVANSP